MVGSLYENAGAGSDWPSRFGPAERFVLCCLVGEEAAARNLLEAGIDLETVARFALYHEVVGEVTAFSAKAALPLPAELLSGLDVHTSRLRAQVETLTRATLRLAGRLHHAGLDALFVKGAVAHVLYRPAGVVRTSKDLDVLVRLQDMERVLAALPADYELFEEARGRSMKRLAAKLHHLSAWAVDDEVAVEIHWDLAAPWHAFPYDLEAALGRGVPVPIGEGEVMTLREDDAVVFWALELSKDSWVSLKKIFDFARSVDAAGADRLRSAFASARAAGTARMLRIGLLVAERLTLLSLPQVAREFVAEDPTASRIADACLRRLVRAGGRGGLAERVEEGLLFARKHDDLAAKLRHVWNIIIVYRVKGWLGMGPH